MRHDMVWRCAVRGLLTGIILALQACSSDGPLAPVDDRSTPFPRPLSPTETPVAPTGPNSYLIKKGDTLFGIALDHGMDYKELAAWNEMTNPNRVIAGRTLRLTPPPGYVKPSEAESKAIPPTALKTEPRAQKIMYIEPGSKAPETAAPNTPAA